MDDSDIPDKDQGPMDLGEKEDAGEEEEELGGAMADLAEAALNEAANVAPEAARPYLRRAQRAVQPAASFVEAQIPAVLALYERLAKLWQKAERYQPLQYVGILVGIIMVFFGGTFAATIAAVEAFRQIAWKDCKVNAARLWQQYQVADQAAAKDEAEHDAAGLPASGPERDAALRRRALVIFKAVDPEIVSNSTSAIWSGLFAVVCSLRVKFAHAVALGAAIGDMTTSLVHRHLEQLVQDMVDPSLHKYIPFVSSWLCRSFAISMAWVLQRIIVAFHSALRGANLVVKGFVQVLVDRKLLDPAKLPPPESARYHSVIYAIAGFGFLCQLRSGFSLPFPLNLLLMPFTMFEWGLTLVVGTWNE